MYMDRKIFDMQLSVEATSLYILACAVVEQGEQPTLERLRAQWNGTPAQLRTAARELIARAIANLDGPFEHGHPLHLNDRNNWLPVSPETP
jgi:hypothetical protein